MKLIKKRGDNLNFNDRILLNELKFNDTDDQIIDYIKLDMNRVINQSIQKTAEELFTVPNTIVRFAKKLGYKGISDLKFALRQEVEKLGIQKENSTIETHTLKNMPENIIRTLDVIDFLLVQKVARKMKEAKRVILIGIGDSTYFCEMLMKNLRCVGKSAEFFQHRHDIIYNVDNCDNKDLYIVISVSGESRTIVESVKIAKSRGAYIVSLTHFSENTLCKLSDLNLYYWAPPQIINNYNSTDRVGIMILLRSISEAFWKEYKL